MDRRIRGVGYSCRKDTCARIGTYARISNRGNRGNSERNRIFARACLFKAENIGIGKCFRRTIFKCTCHLHIPCVSASKKGMGVRGTVHFFLLMRVQAADPIMASTRTDPTMAYSKWLLMPGTRLLGTKVKFIFWAITVFP